MEPNQYQFLTIYKKDYKEKLAKTVQKCTGKQEFPDPIREGFRHYLVLDEEQCNILPPNEDGEAYFDKFGENYPKISKRYFQTPIQKGIILRNKITKGIVSEYQMNYCDIEKDIAFYLEKKKRKAILSDDAEVPLTTYTTYYRDPAILCPTVRDPSIIIKGLDTLGSFENKINDILNVKTGITEYDDSIGKLGGIIVREGVHRKIEKPLLLPKI